MSGLAEGIEARIHKSLMILQAIEAEAIPLALEAEGVFRQFAGSDQLVLEDDVVIKEPPDDVADRCRTALKTITKSQNKVGKTESSILPQLRNFPGRLLPAIT